nr:MAG TPA: hypothetical protein [Caudoviricetes sp.]DAY21913.1 MAG TPA: hypothetical protein [Caudoviricetes sp.]
MTKSIIFSIFVKIISNLCIKLKPNLNENHLKFDVIRVILKSPNR